MIEGVDHTGKSSFARLVASFLACENPELGAPPIVHLGREGATLGVREMVARCAPWTIADRFHLSEMAYGQVLRGRSGLKAALPALEKRIAACFGFTVLFVPSAEELTRRLELNPDDTYTALELAEVNVEFVRILNDRSPRGVVFFPIQERVGSQWYRTRARMVAETYAEFHESKRCVLGPELVAEFVKRLSRSIPRSKP